MRLQRHRRIGYDCREAEDKNGYGFVEGMIVKLQVLLNTYAREVFRDQADQDYISARSIWRLRFREQFLWASLQAMEKYLKGTLLFNGVSARYVDGSNAGRKAKMFSHDLVKLLTAVKKIEGVEFSFPPEVEHTLDYINHYGNNRYFDRATYTVGDELLSVDAAVWHIRRYCQYLRFGFETPEEEEEATKRYVSWLNSPERLESPWRLRLPSGLIERLVEGERTPARDALVWNNLYYGKVVKSSITVLLRHEVVNPPNVRTWARDPQNRAQLEKYVLLRD